MSFFWHQIPRNAVAIEYLLTKTEIQRDDNLFMSLSSFTEKTDEFFTMREQARG